MERLQKVIANYGYTSRRNAEKLIEEHRVLVNGNEAVIGMKVSNDDVIQIDGKTLIKNEKKVYYLLNKPRGVICSASDEKGRKTVVELIDSNERIYPIGRLDYDTTGLLLLTNDGDLANHLMHPSNNILKTYLAKLEGVIDAEAIAKLKGKIIIDDKPVKIVDFKVKRKDIVKNTSFVSITIIEGRNHIVKKIFESLHFPVEKLTRTNYAFLDIKGMNSGDYRLLTLKEVKKLYSL